MYFSTSGFNSAAGIFPVIKNVKSPAFEKRSRYTCSILSDSLSRNKLRSSTTLADDNRIATASPCPATGSSPAFGIASTAVPSSSRKPLGQTAVARKSCTPTATYFPHPPARRKRSRIIQFPDTRLTFQTLAFHFPLQCHRIITPKPQAFTNGTVISTVGSISSSYKEVPPGL